LLEEHCSYMVRYQARMIARGRTLADDGTATGSVHILALPDPAAARAFAFDEPNYQAGVYRDVAAPVAQPALANHVGLLRRPGRLNLYLVLGLGSGRI
jgi:uncharacterized protein YciI